MNGNGIDKMPSVLENKAENNLKILMGVGRVYDYDTPIHKNKFPEKELNRGVLTGTVTVTEDSPMEVKRIYPNELSSVDPDLAYQKKKKVFASDDESLTEQSDLCTASKQNQGRTSLLESSPVDEVSPSKDFSSGSLPRARRDLDYCITAPVQRTLFLDSQEATISKSMIERRGSPRPDLKLDRLSEHEKKKLIVNLVKIQSDGTVEVDLTKGAHEASELLELQPDLQPDEAIPRSTDYIMTGYDKPIPKLNIALLIVGTRGDVQPFLAIARRLQEFGHHVRLATHSNFSGFVKLAGVGFYPLGGDPHVLAGYMARNKGLIPSGPGEITMQRKQIKAIIESLLPACTEPDPVTGEPFTAQAIIANPPAYGHAHVAEALGVPLHIFFTMPWTPTYAFPHPLARVPQSAAYWLSYILVDLLIWWGIRSYINDFRKNKLKLAPIAYFSTYHGSISHLPTGYMWSPNVVPKPNDWGPLVDVVGYCFINLGSKYEPTEEFLQWIKKSDEPIYIGFGSMPLEDSKKTTVIILEALKNTGQRGIIDRGWGNLDENIPDNVFLLVDCPHDWLFPQCSAVVHHGGAGTTATGLQAGCPTTIVPFFGDQFFWGERVYQKGLGPAPIPISQLSVESLSEAIQFMLQPEVKSRVMELALHIQNEDGVGAAVDAFHRHLPPQLPIPSPPHSEKDETPSPLQWIFIQIGRLCCLPCGGS
ncbi:sterol 3-beta-glucosyltransferase UGT80B1-like isoform X2 [Primulina huaijiensis]|uniref:sterol 3-beta-glucosyltransferase UGT80B1-like isoform X2 n=1 Tax=Primulina huaijiensis TaxID=1492673 RepID=UPI003CC6F9D5